MAKLNKNEQALQDTIEEVTAPLTDLLDAIANLEGAEDREEASDYREEIDTLASDALSAWPALEKLLAKATNFDPGSPTVEESFIEGFNDGRS